MKTNYRHPTYDQVSSDSTKRLENGATLIEATYWRNGPPRERLVLAYFGDKYVSWLEYQQMEGQPYTCHGHYYGEDEEEAREAYKKRERQEHF